jgi:hypothetical protein
MILMAICILYVFVMTKFIKVLTKNFIKKEISDEVGTCNPTYQGGRVQED